MDGSHNSMLQNSLKVYTGAIEIYKKGYRDIGGNEYLLRDVSDIEASLKEIKGINSLPRVTRLTDCSLQKISRVPLCLRAIKPKKEAIHSQLKVALVEGGFLSETSKNCVYMGSELKKNFIPNLVVK